MAVSLQPAGPLVTQQGNEAIGIVGSAYRALDALPARRVSVEFAHAPVVVVGECRNIEPGRIASVVEVCFGCPGSVRELRVAVQVRPQDPGPVGADDQRAPMAQQAADLRFVEVRV